MLHIKIEQRQRNDKLVLLCDVVIEGRFIEELKDPSLLWRGSSNQRMFFRGLEIGSLE